MIWIILNHVSFWLNLSYNKWITFGLKYTIVLSIFFCFLLLFGFTHLMCCVCLLCFVLLFGFLLILILFFLFLFLSYGWWSCSQFCITMNALVFIWFSSLKDIITIMGCIFLFTTFRSKGRDPSSSQPLSF